MGEPANPAQIRTGSLKLASLDSSGQKDPLYIHSIYGHTKSRGTEKSRDILTEMYLSSAVAIPGSLVDAMHNMQSRMLNSLFQFIYI